MSLAIFYFSSWILNMFRALICPKHVEYLKRKIKKIASDIWLVFYSSAIKYLLNKGVYLARDVNK